MQNKTGRNEVLCPATPVACLLNNPDTQNKVYIKRDDMIPVSFGGNKARKAQYFFCEINAGKYDCIVTYGSSSSNHCRIISNLAAGRGIPCYIIGPQESFESTFNSQMMKLFGAKCTIVPVKDVHDTIEKILEQLRSEGKKPYFIPGGGHGNLGTQAYVDCYDEIRQWEKKNNIFFDYIFHTSGTGTTQAGLICGKLIHKDKRQIIGISNARKNPYGSQVVLDSVNDYLKSINRKSVTMDEVCFIDDYVLDGYGCYNQEILQTIREMLIKEGIPLDPTYTGKAFWGMKEYIKQSDIQNKNILFIHTGGTPLFFDHLGDLIDE